MVRATSADFETDLGVCAIALGDVDREGFSQVGRDDAPLRLGEPSFGHTSRVIRLRERERERERFFVSRDSEFGLSRPKSLLARFLRMETKSAVGAHLRLVRRPSARETSAAR